MQIFAKFNNSLSWPVLVVVIASRRLITDAGFTIGLTVGIDFLYIGKVNTNKKQVVGGKIEEAIIWLRASKARNANNKANNININKVTASRGLEREIGVKALNF